MINKNFLVKNPTKNPTTRFLLEREREREQ